MRFRAFVTVGAGKIAVECRRDGQSEMRPAVSLTLETPGNTFTLKRWIVDEKTFLSQEKSRVSNGFIPNVPCIAVIGSPGQGKDFPVEIGVEPSEIERSRIEQKQLVTVGNLDGI